MALANYQNKLWIGSPAGLFVHGAGSTKPVVYEIPFASVHTLALAGDALLAAGLPPNLIYSGDGGNRSLRATI